MTRSTGKKVNFGWIYLQNTLIAVAFARWYFLLFLSSKKMTFYRTFNLTQKNHFCGALLSAILIPYQYHIIINEFKLHYYRIERVLNSADYSFSLFISINRTDIFMKTLVKAAGLIRSLPRWGQDDRRQEFISSWGKIYL